MHIGIIESYSFVSSLGHSSILKWSSQIITNKSPNLQTSSSTNTNQIFSISLSWS